MKYSSEERERIQKAYVERKPYLDEAKKRLHDLVAQTILQIEDKSLVRAKIRAERVKSFESVLRKAMLKELHEDSILHGIHDLVGVRAGQTHLIVLDSRISRF